MNTTKHEQAPAKIHPQTGAPADTGTAQAAAIPQVQYSALFDELTALGEGTALVKNASALLRILEERDCDEKECLQEAGSNPFVRIYLIRSKDTSCLLDAAQEILANALRTIEQATKRAYSVLHNGMPADETPQHN